MTPQVYDLKYNAPCPLCHTMSGTTSKLKSQYKKTTMNICTKCGTIYLTRTIAVSKFIFRDLVGRTWNKYKL